MRHAFHTTVIAACLAAGVLIGAAPAAAGEYLVVYKRQSVPADARSRIAQADGRLLHAYPEIGVAVVRSGDAGFRRELLLEDGRVDGVIAAGALAFQLPETSSGLDAAGPPEGDLPNAPAADMDTFSALQWNTRQIQAPEAHAITGGSRLVAVADLDSGLDFRHPDLASNVDFARSASCQTGAPIQDPTGTAWDDDIGHGTFTAGLIAAASNGVGIVGVAPNVSIAAIKISNAQGTITWPAVVCGLVWAGRQHFDVANNSYAVDPSRYYCHNNPAQRIVIKAVQRAVQFARREGVTVVASAGNENFDLAHPPLGNDCPRVPTELPGVITVSADGSLRQKAFYSNYGVGEIDLTAPGGDPAQPTPTPFGTILSTYPNPARLPVSQRTRVIASGGAFYRFDFGTSFAAPHVTGVAALIISRYGDLSNPENGKMRPGQVEALLQQTADPIPCPPDPFAPVIGPPVLPTPTAFPAECQGGEGYNAFFGHGQVNALRAITHVSGNG
jgi:subtilisin family serine protease